MMGQRRLLTLLLLVAAVAIGKGQEQDTEEEEEAAAADVRVLEIRSDVRHRYCRTRLYSVVANRASQPRLLTFRAALPDAAFISALAVTSGGQVTHGRVEEREQARDTFDAAAREGRTAARAEAASSARDARLFTVALQVAAGDTAAFNLTYEQLLEREQGRYRLRHMLDPGQVVQQLLVEVRIEDSLPLTGVRAASLRALDNEVDPSAPDSDEPLATVERPAPTEAVVRWRPDAEAQASLADGSGAGLQGLLEIQYDVDRNGSGGSELVIGDGGYFVHFFAPPEHQMAPLPKHAVFVLDTSGSMSGTKIRQLKAAMGVILSELRAEDVFSLVLFHSGAWVWSASARAFVETSDPQRLPHGAIADAGARSVAAARDAIDAAPALGATHMWTALRVAYALVRAGQQTSPSRWPLFFFLTDGQPNGPHSAHDDLLALVGHEAPLFALAFGDAADFAFLKRLALRGDGFARRVYEASDAALQLRRLYTRVASPLLANVSFHYAVEQVDASSLTRTSFPVHLWGAELTVAGRLRSPLAAQDALDAQVLSTDANASASTTATTMRLDSHAAFVERLWAYLTVRELLERGAGDDEAARAEALRLALRYSFVTPLTSLVAVAGGGQGQGRGQQPNVTLLQTRLRDASSPRQQPSSSTSATGSAVGNRNHVASGNRGVARLAMAMAMPAPGPRRGRPRSKTISNPSSMGRMMNAVNAEGPRGARDNNSNSTLLNEKVPLSEFHWLSDGVSGNGTHVFVSEAATGVVRAYLVSEPTLGRVAEVSCAARVGAEGWVGSCVPLAQCALKIFAQSVEHFRPAFCVLHSEYAGACCPTGWSTGP